MAPETPYSSDSYEEELRRAEGQSFPQHLVVPEGEKAVQTQSVGFTGIIPRGAEDFTTEQTKDFNSQDNLDREKAWHHLANPHKPLTARHKEFCRLIARGLPYYEIAKQIGYTSTYMSILSAHPKLRAEVDRIQEKQLEASIDDRMKEANHKAFDVIEEMITDPATKDSLRFESAKWLLEKTTGKAAQKIETKDQNLGDFMSLLRESMEARKSGEAGAKHLPDREERETIDVTPAAPDRDPISDFVDNET